MFAPPQEPGCNFVQNADQQRVSWKENLPIHLRVHKSVPRPALLPIRRAIADYANVLGKTIFVIDDWQAEGPGTPQKDGVSTIYWLKQWEVSGAKQQARTTLYWNGDQINEADIRINAANFGFTDDAAISPRKIDLESLMVHELGHVLGLSHDTTPGSVMNFFLKDGQLRRNVGVVDLASLHCEY